jgi:hypothetical protein
MPSLRCLKRRDLHYTEIRLCAVRRAAMSQFDFSFRKVVTVSIFNDEQSTAQNFHDARH